MTVADAEILETAERELSLVTTLNEAEAFRRKWLGVNGQLRSLVFSHPGYFPRFERLQDRYVAMVLEIRKPGAVAVSQFLDDAAPLPDPLWAIAVGALTNITSMVMVFTFPGAEPESLRQVVSGMVDVHFAKGMGRTVGEFRRDASAYLRELAERLEPMAKGEAR